MKQSKAIRQSKAATQSSTNTQSNTNYFFTTIEMLKKMEIAKSVSQKIRINIIYNDDPDFSTNALSTLSRLMKTCNPTFLTLCKNELKKAINIFYCLQQTNLTLEENSLTPTAAPPQETQAIKNILHILDIAYLKAYDSSHIATINDTLQLAR